MVAGHRVSVPGDIRRGHPREREAAGDDHVALSRRLPTRVSADYIKFAVVDKDFDQPLLALPPAVLEGFPHGGQIEMLTADAAERDGDTYLVFNTQGTAAIRYYGYLPDGSVENFEDQMRSSPDWSVYAQDDNSTIFRYTGGPRR